MNTATKIVIALVIGLVLGYLIGVSKAEAPADGNNDSEMPSDAEKTSDTSSTMMVGKNAIVVSDQAPGNTVVVSQVVFEKTGWAVVHEDRDGAPGNILGAQRFEAGTSKGTIELLRGTVEGGKYYVMLHSDNGDGTFDHKVDLPIKDSDGNVIMGIFTVRAGALPPADVMI